MKNWEDNFKDKFWTQLIDDYGDEHLYDAIKLFIEDLLQKREKEILE